MNSIGILIIVVIAIFVLYKLAIFNSNELEAAAEESKDKFDTFVNQIQKSGELPVILTTLNLGKNEFAIMEGRSSLYEIKSFSTRAYAGTKVKMGNFPIFLGGSQGQRHEKLAKASDGKLVLTNKRIVFVGDKRSWESKHQEILQIGNAVTEIQISSKRYKKPVVFTVSNGAYWVFLNWVLSKYPVDSPKLPVSEFSAIT